jgi:hypothetical protein
MTPRTSSKKALASFRRQYLGPRITSRSQIGCGQRICEKTRDPLAAAMPSLTLVVVGSKTWEAERYGLIAPALAEFGIRSLVTFGPEEGNLTNRVELPGQEPPFPCHPH